MEKMLIYVLLLSLGLSMSGCGDNDENVEEKDTEIVSVSPSKTNKMNLYVHYMPWFETPETNEGKWGSHWTMANCDPNIVDAEGKRQIASHYYPLTGPYASTDAAILDYQCLLMKYAGVDGVMIDWYGTQSVNDYLSNARNTEAMVKAVTKAGLKFAIVYEDATLAHAADKVTQARLDMRYLATHFFKSEHYAKINDKPLLLVFGPQQMTTPKDWYRTFSILYTPPTFLCLNGHIGNANNQDYTNAQGEYLWVNANPDYSIAKKFETYIGGAMPGFYDYYEEGGVGAGYTTYDSEDGALFQRQLDAARSAGLEWLQVSTWNDYGEGTNIEPTIEYGYKYLVMLQKFAGVTYNQSDLERIYRWYKVCKAKPTDSRVAEAYKLLVSLQTDKAEQLIKEME